MIIGLLSGLFWALNTLFLGIAFALPMYANNIYVPLAFTFLHDLFSFLLLFFYKGVKKNKDVFKILLTKKGRWLIVSSLLGGPLGMTFYFLSISYLGSAYSAMLSSLYPAFGLLFSCIFLKEKVNKKQILGFLLCIFGAILLGYAQTNAGTHHFIIGFIFALLCCMGWGSESCIISYVVKDNEISNEDIVEIREGISFLVYGVVIMNVFHLWNIVYTSYNVIIYIILASIVGILSYLFYFYTIKKKGVIIAMPLNITYSAWAILLSLIFLSQIPTLKDCICTVLIFLGAMLCAI